MSGRDFERSEGVPHLREQGKTSLKPASRALLCTWMLVLLAGCGAASDPSAGPVSTTSSPVRDANPPVLFAAASLTEVIGKLEPRYREGTSTEAWSVSFGPSSGLARQILAGAPARLFLSADVKWAREVAKAQPRSKVATFLGNRMVLIVPASSDFQELSLAQLVDDRIQKIAIANPDGVPAGVTAKQVLERSGLWEKLQAKLVPGDDVRQARAYVERGEAEAGIVYATDVPSSESVASQTGASPAKVRVAAAIDTTLHDPIRYGFVLIDSDDVAAARLFDWLQTPPAHELFKASGFVIDTAPTVE
jgi:molybdate transport system substrate-binding protein